MGYFQRIQYFTMSKCCLIDEAMPQGTRVILKNESPRPSLVCNGLVLGDNSRTKQWILRYYSLGLVWLSFSWSPQPFRFSSTFEPLSTKSLSASLHVKMYFVPTTTKFSATLSSTPLRLAISYGELHVSLCRQLSVPLCPASIDFLTFLSIGMDALGDQAITCSNDCDMMAGYNIIMTMVSRFCELANVSPALETKSLKNFGHRRSGDITVANWSCGSLLVLDATTH